MLPAPAPPPESNVLALAHNVSILIVGLSALTAAAVQLSTGETALSVGIVCLGVCIAIARGASSAPVLLVAVVLQWLQFECALIYRVSTGRRIPELAGCDYTPMVIASLLALLALIVGVRIGEGPRRSPVLEPEEALLPGWGLVAIWSAFLAATPLIDNFAWSLSGLTQFIYSASQLRLVALFILIRRLLRARRSLAIAAMALVEILAGGSGYFAAFKDPLGIIGVALVDRLRARRISHWLALGSLSLLTFVLFVVWTGVKFDLRRQARFHGGALQLEERIDRLQSATDKWVDRGPELWLRSTDQLVSRVWVIYYPALAMRRIPASRPHEDGRLLWSAITYSLTPRLFFPEKPTLRDADSSLVRQYAGVWVAGARESTSIAFGHIGESYVDFGWWGVGIYELVFGLLVGCLLRLVPKLIRDRELALGMASVVGLLALYSPNTSWTKLIGGTLNVFLTLAAIGFALDRTLRERRR